MLNPQEFSWARLDLHAAGVQSFPGVLAFAVNTYKGWSTPAQEEFDVQMDVDGDGQPDYVVFNGDVGLVLTGSRNGQMGSFVFNVKANTFVVRYLATAPTDASTIVLPANLADIGISATSADSTRIWLYLGSAASSSRSRSGAESERFRNNSRSRSCKLEGMHAG